MALMLMTTQVRARHMDATSKSSSKKMDEKEINFNKPVYVRWRKITENVNYSPRIAVHSTSTKRHTIPEMIRDNKTSE